MQDIEKPTPALDDSSDDSDYDSNDAETTATREDMSVEVNEAVNAITNLIDLVKREVECYTMLVGITDYRGSEYKSRKRGTLNKLNGFIGELTNLKKHIEEGENKSGGMSIVWLRKDFLKTFASSVELRKAMDIAYKKEGSRLERIGGEYLKRAAFMSLGHELIPDQKVVIDAIGKFDKNKSEVFERGCEDIKTNIRTLRHAVDTELMCWGKKKEIEALLGYDASYVAIGSLESFLNILDELQLVIESKNIVKFWKLLKSTKDMWFDCVEKGFVVPVGDYKERKDRASRLFLEVCYSFMDLNVEKSGEIK